MKTFTYPTHRQALYGIAHQVSFFGDRVSPRGLPTYEFQNVMIKVEDSRYCLMNDMGRNFNPRLAAAEALQLLAGIADPVWITKASPRYLEYTGGAMTGAYGPRLREQLPFVEELLRKNPDTRQATATIWDPERDLYVEHGDRPCTNLVHFMIRGGQLTTTTYMRSEDIYRGYTFDMTMFSMLHQTMANVLEVTPGPHIHCVQSLHAYESDLSSIMALRQPTDGASSMLTGLKASSWHSARDQALSIAYASDSATELSEWKDDPTYRWLRTHSLPARSGTS